MKTRFFFPPLHLIAMTNPRLIRAICLSSHPIRATLPSALLLRPGPCPLFNLAERLRDGGEQIDLLRGLRGQYFCCWGQCQARALHVPLGVSCWHHYKYLLFVDDKAPLVFVYSTYFTKTSTSIFIHTCILVTWLTPNSWTPFTKSTLFHYQSNNN